MNFLALLLGLGVERALTQLFHLREFRWLDPLFDLVFRRTSRLSAGLAMVVLLATALLVVAPVIYVSVMLAGRPQGLGFFAFAVLVLLFSLGPRDLEQETADYCAAASRGDADALGHLARELAEQDVPAAARERCEVVERAVYLQANNRIFSVVFWFLVLGPAAPAGAWLFRVIDLMRRRAAFHQPAGEIAMAIRTLHGLLAWIPGRLMAAAFALAGSFEGAAAAWRRAAAGISGHFFERTDRIIGHVGQEARGPASERAADTGAAGEAALIGSAMGLVRRTLWLIWYPVIALLTLGNWLR